MGAVRKNDSWFLRGTPSYREMETRSMSELLNDISCPGCDLKEPDPHKQREHMEANHPEIIAARLVVFNEARGYED